MQDKKPNKSDTGVDNKTPAFYKVLFNSREVGGRYVKHSRTVASFRPIKLLDSLVQAASYASTRVYGWFAINWFYVLALLAFFVGVFVWLYFLAKWIMVKLHNASKQG